MAGPTDESTRAPAFAGLFYPADDSACHRSARAMLENAGRKSDGQTKWLGGIVPHAGWVYSGAIAAQTLATLGRGVQPDVVVVFGAIHTPLPTPVAALDIHRRWQTPGEDFEIAGHLQAMLLESNNLFRIDARFHEREHAVEVELPLIRAVWPNAMILPVEVPAIDAAVSVGQTTARQSFKAGLKAMYLASSDLTHYGPSYGFTPSGIGPSALNWAMENDQRMLQLVTDMRVDRIVPESRSRRNACGGGAIAAMLAACREHGATDATLLQHTNSSEVSKNVRGSASADAVGYASVVVA
jgi:hypothetical protein